MEKSIGTAEGRQKVVAEEEPCSERRNSREGGCDVNEW